MQEYLSEFLLQYNYPKEACDRLRQALDRIEAGPGTGQDFTGLLDCYKEDMKYDFKELLDRMADICNRAGIHVYTGHLLLLICMSRTLKEYYQKAGVDERIWFISMSDLKWKLDECWCVHGIWGTFVPSWYDGFFQMNCFGFGRLQFERWRFGIHYEGENVALEPDSQVINVHIPRTGARLDPESLRESYREAAAFYREQWEGRPLVFVCHSWLLFPRNREVLSPESNLYAFFSDYAIAEWGVDEDYSEVWRLFDVEYRGDVEQLPQNTSLRRAYADWIRKGEKTGWGYGVFVYPQ